MDFATSSGKAKMTYCALCGQPISLQQTILNIINGGSRDITTIRLLAKNKINATDKEISNALGKLVQHKKVKHIGYGLYASIEICH